MTLPIRRTSDSAVQFVLLNRRQGKLRMLSRQ